MRRASLALSVVGLALSAWLTVEHYGSSSLLACPATSTINCAKVTTSRHSVLLGVPVALLGLLFYAAMTALTTPWAWRRPQLAAVRTAAAAAGSLMVLWLIWVELFDVGAVCLWCTGVHLVTVTLLGVVLLVPPEVRPAPASPSRSSASATR